MSRSPDFDDVRTESYPRLLLQLYASCGDARAAEAALQVALAAARRSWPAQLPPAADRDRWLRGRAFRHLGTRSGRPPPTKDGALMSATTFSRAIRHGQAPARTGANPDLLSALARLDIVSRRLLVVRRLGGCDLAEAATELGLTAAAAEQSLARSTSALHAAGIDTTPAGLQARLERLADDLRSLGQPPRERPWPWSHRWSLTGVVSVALALVGVVVAAWVLGTSDPFHTSGSSGAPPPPSLPSATTPQTPTPSSGPSSTPVHIGPAQLLTVQQVAAAAGSAWRPLPPVVRTPDATVYGDCVPASDNPPPSSSWIREFAAPGDDAAPGRLRQVLQLAPSEGEATRSLRGVVSAFAACAGTQLLSYEGVAVVGDRARLVDLRLPGPNGPVEERVAVARSNRAVVVLVARSGPGVVAVSAAQLARLAAAGVNQVCGRSAGGCAFAPYLRSPLPPPRTGEPVGFLSAGDLPIVDGAPAPLVGGDPRPVDDRAAAVPCGRKGLTGAGAGGVVERRYLTGTAGGPQPSLTETIGRFRSPAVAKGFVSDITSDMASCHGRLPALAVEGAAPLPAGPGKGWVWRVAERPTSGPVTTYRVGLVRVGDRVARMVLRPAASYDVPPGAWLALTERARERLAG